MIHRFAVLVVLAAALASPIRAQATATPPHPGHPANMPHDPTMHAGMDSAAHAALHALLVGLWHGTFSAAHGHDGAMSLTIAHDSAQHMRLHVTGDTTLTSGTSFDPTITGDTLRWTQTMAGAPCKATAVMAKPTAAVAKAATAPTMRGRMTCAKGDIAFTLVKKAG